MPLRKSIPRTFFVHMSALATGAVVLLGALWIYQEYGRFRREAAHTRQESLVAREEFLRDQVGDAVAYVEFLRSQVETRVRATLRSRVETAHTIATGLFHRYEGQRARAEIQEMILAALGSIRFEGGRGYYFVGSLQEERLLLAGRPDQVGWRPSDATDERSADGLAALFQGARERGEGFQTYWWTRPDRPGEDVLQKISFFRYFAPFDWLIGTGEYLDVVTEEVQREALEWLGKIRFDDEGYIFVGRWDGLSLLGPGRGKNMLDVTDPNGVRVVQELVSAARAGGGFVSYVMPRLEGARPEPKLSYARGIPEWGWYVGAGVNLGEIEEAVAAARSEMLREVRTKVLQILGVLALLLLGVFLTARRAARRTKSAVEAFTGFFRQAASGSAEVEPRAFDFREFQELAEEANRMLVARRGAERALRESEAQVRLLLESTAEAIYAVDLQGRCTLANPSCLRLLGFRDPGELIGRNIHHLIHHTRPDGTPYPEEECRIYAAFREGRGCHVDDEVLWRKDGSSFPAEYRSHPIHREGRVMGSVITFLARTERREAETRRRELQRQLRQAQKMEAVGQLAGGVAHDFNNLLQVITGYVDLAQRNPTPLPARVRSALDGIGTASERAGRLVRQLLAFSHREVAEPRPVNLNELIRGIAKMLRRVIGERIELVTSLEAEPGTVEADPGHLEQVLLNLCLNARDAMPAGGTLTVGTANATLDLRFLRGAPGARAGPHVSLWVSDTGEGIPEAVRDRMFEPFFTTKEVGKGTGLGLATVYGIVKQNRGVIRVASRPGRGSTFSVYLPVSGPPAPSLEKPGSPEPETGTETVLVAEDDAMVRELTQEVLEEHGYRVLAAANGSDAVDRFHAHAGEIALVILDVAMPGLRGPEAAEHLRAVRPELPLLFITGYDFDLAEDGFGGTDGVRVIRKPFSYDELLRVVREVLAAGAETPGPR